MLSLKNSSHGWGTLGSVNGWRYLTCVCCKPLGSVNCWRETQTSKQYSALLIKFDPNITCLTMAATSSDAPEKSVCKLCDKQFEPPNDPLIQCDRCDGWICLHCANMSDEQYKFFISETNKNISHLWFCTNCFPSATTCVKTDNEIEENARVTLKDSIPSSQQRYLPSKKI